MPRYFFHVFDHVEAVDEEGRELPNLAAAITEAVAGARELAAAHILAGRPIDRSNRIEIVGEDGATYAVSFEDVVKWR